MESKCPLKPQCPKMEGASLGKEGSHSTYLGDLVLGSEFIIMSSALTNGPHLSPTGLLFIAGLEAGGVIPM